MAPLLQKRKMDPVERETYQALAVGVVLMILADLYVIYLLFDSGKIVWTPFQNIGLGCLAFSAYGIPKIFILTIQYRRQFT